MGFSDEKGKKVDSVVIESHWMAKQSDATFKSYSTNRQSNSLEEHNDLEIDISLFNRSMLFYDSNFQNN